MKGVGRVSGKYLKKCLQIFQFSWKLYIPRSKRGWASQTGRKPPQAHCTPMAQNQRQRGNLKSGQRERTLYIQRNEDKDKVRKAVGAAKRSRWSVAAGRDFCPHVLTDTSRQTISRCASLQQSRQPALPRGQPQSALSVTKGTRSLWCPTTFRDIKQVPRIVKGFEPHEVCSLTTTE